MKENKIRNIPSIQKLLKQIESLSALQQFANQTEAAKTLSAVLGIDLNNLSLSSEKLEDLKKKAEELASIPDRFNQHFTKLGWVIYKEMKLEVIVEAIKQADSGQIEQAEQTLVNYYTTETVKFWLNHMNRIQAFRPRMRLAKLALVDYNEKRYHASIPIVLALIDGLVNELNKGRGFFADETGLEAWDSIAGHKTGLSELAGIFRQGRNKTRTEKITIPYRNGIMHGNDLGYDNQIVAAKTWAALFAVGEWAYKAEKQELNEPPKQLASTPSSVFEQLKKNRDLKNKISEWKPRVLKVGVDFPAIGTSDNYIDGTPEKRLVEFLTLWENKNYGGMAQYIPYDRKISVNAIPQRVREVFASRVLKIFEITEIIDLAAATTEIKVQLKYLERERLVEKNHNFRLLYIDERGNSNVRGKEGYDWFINNWQYTFVNRV